MMITSGNARNSTKSGFTYLHQATETQSREPSCTCKINQVLHSASYFCRSWLPNKGKQWRQGLISSVFQTLFISRFHSANLIIYHLISHDIFNT
jgi:hypothetical protein